MNIKNQMFEQMLKPVGIKKEQFVRLSGSKNAIEKLWTKREICAQLEI